MKLDKQYLENLLNKNIIPKSAWSSKYYDNELCYVIKNEIYCKVFWLDFWFNYLSVKFKNQNMIQTVKNQDLTLPVIINQNLKLINVPPTIQSIDYFAQPKINDTLYRINVPIFNMLVIAVIVLVIIVTVTILFFKKSVYSDII